MRTIAFVAALATISAAANAQTAPAPSAAGQDADALGGPAIAGVCLLARQSVFTSSKVGQAADARLRALAQEAQQEIDIERKPVDADIQAFNAESAKLSPDQRQERQRALQARLQPIEAKTQVRAREITATREKAGQRIFEEARPVIAQIYKQHNCGLLVERDAVIGGNMANDLTQAVVQGLDARISTITFDREKLPAETAGASTR